MHTEHSVMRIVGLGLLLVVLVLGWHAITANEAPPAGSGGYMGGSQQAAAGANEGSGNVGNVASSEAMQVVDEGLNQYDGAQLVLPPPAGPDELYVAHGDVLGDGTCHVMVFGPGQALTGLSQATWRLVLVQGGTLAQRQQQIVTIQNELGGCPRA